MRKKRIYIAIADTGGGHRAAANSILDMFNKLYPDKYEIMIDNVFTNTKKLGKQLEDAYARLNSRFTFIYSWSYLLTKIPIILHIVNNIITRASVPITLKNITEFQPDMVISIHPLVEHLLKKGIKKANIHPKKAVVITDPITAHPGWYSYRIYDLYIVSSERLKNVLIKHHIEKDKIKIHCPPLQPKFQRALDDEEINELKNEFDFPKDKKIIFFAGGGEGFKNIQKYLKIILTKPEMLEKAYFVVVTGKNQKQKTMVDNMVKEYPNSFKIFGFTKKMFELTAMSDLVICKAGPATTYQALLLKKPIIHTMYIYGQEKGNVEMVSEYGYGEYIPKIKKLVNELENLLVKNPQKLIDMQNNVRNSHINNGSEGIVKELVRLLETGVSE